ncbi:short chain dehydrogenase [Aquirhabdus sp.]|uniref:short chain dehydrogenase n=1 Tax=Aquirhabdus sp. TaxID=2824160 RepID=UPI00396C9890
MKVIVIGATGTLGKAVSNELAARHDVIEVGKHKGQYQVDLTNSESIKALFEKTGKVDAIIATTGKVHFGPLTEMTAEQFKIGLHDKLLGQIDLVLIGQHYLNAGGSITLTSGILTEQPIRLGVNATTANAALEGFVLAAAAEFSHGIRINIVSPTVLQESLKSYGSFFIGFEPVAASRAALAYSRSVDGIQTGQVYRVW